MKSFLSCLILAALAAKDDAEPTPADAARVAVSLAMAQRPPQAPMTPQAPHVRCYCGDNPANCSCDAGACKCNEGKDCRTTPNAGISLLIICQNDCPPCKRLVASLEAAGQGDDFPDWHCRYRETHPELMTQYAPNLFPTIILLRDGKEIARRVGYASPAELKRWADDPSKPITEGKSGRSTAVLYSGVYSGDAYPPGTSASRPMIRYFSSAACST